LGEVGILTVVKPMRVLLFELFGTPVDWRSSLIDLAEATAVRAGLQVNWAAIASLQRETLTEVLAERNIGLPAAGRELLVPGWRQLQP
jgi:hypothetical protein